MRGLLSTLLLWLALFAAQASAIDIDAVKKLATGDGDERSAAIAALLAEADPRAGIVMRALLDAELYLAGDRVLIVRNDAAIDAITGEAVPSLPQGREEVSSNNRVRRELGAALAALDLLSPDQNRRRAAIDELAGSAEPSVLPLIRKAFQAEGNAGLKSALAMIQASLEIKSGDRDQRLAAVQTLKASDNPATKTLLLSLLEKSSDGEFIE